MRGTSISTLFLMNPTLRPESPKPTDEEETLAKVLFYYPEAAPVYEIQSNVGLSEGLMMFVRQFTEKPLEYCATERCTHILKECEPDVWLYIVLQHPASEGMVKAQDLYCTQDVMNRLVDSYYEGFFLFHGALSAFKTKPELEVLKELLSDYTAAFLCEFGVEEDPFSGFYYCPLDRKSFLLVQFLVNQILTERAEVKHIMVLFEGHYVSSSLPHAHSCLLYRYLCKDKDWRRIATYNRGLDPAKCQYMRVKSFPDFGYLYGLCESEIHMPIIRFRYDGSQYQLLVWVQDGVQYVLLLTPADYQFLYLRELGEKLQNQVAMIRAAVVKQVKQAAEVESPFRYFYYNNMNFAIKKGGRLADVDPDLASLIRHVTAQFNAPGESSDILVKSTIRTSSGWICCINSMNSRQIFLLLPGANLAIQKVEEELARFVQEYLQTIFLGVKY